MPSRVVKPETKMLPISDDDWLIVKRRLNHGEVSRIYIRGHDPDGRVLPIKNGMAKVAMYLIDWSLTNPDGSSIIIRGASLDEIEAALDGLDSSSVFEIHQAILAHEDAIAAELDAEKKTRSTASASSPTSTSPAPAAGDTSGSATSTPTSTTSSSVN